MTHRYATQAKCFQVKYTHRYILYTHTTMRYRCEILNHGIDGYEVWLHGRNQGRSGVKARKYLNRESLLKLYNCFVFPYLTYCVEVWGQYDRKIFRPSY